MENKNSHIKLDKVFKKIKDKNIITDVSFDFSNSKIYGLIGPNGAGKTTIIRLLCGIIKPTQGKVILKRTKEEIGYMPEELALYTDMTVEKEIFYFGKIRGLTKIEVIKRVTPLISDLNIKNYMNTPIANLSRGNKRKVQFVCSILHNPSLIILDEPFSGIDIISSQKLQEIILNLNSTGKTIIISTHEIEWAEQLCDEVCLLNKGVKILQEDLNQLIDKENSGIYLIKFFSKITPTLCKDLYLKPADDTGYSFYVNNNNLNNFLNKSIEINVLFERIEQIKPKLRDVFIDKVKEYQ